VSYPADPETIVGLIAQATAMDAGTAVAVLAKRAQRGAIPQQATRRDIAAGGGHHGGAAVRAGGGDGTRAGSRGTRLTATSEAVDYLRYYRRSRGAGTPRFMGHVLESETRLPRGRGGHRAGTSAGDHLADGGGRGQRGDSEVYRAVMPVNAHELVRILREAGASPEVVQHRRGWARGSVRCRHPRTSSHHGSSGWAGDDRVGGENARGRRMKGDR
jgi:hypothetical protein